MWAFKADSLLNAARILRPEIDAFLASQRTAKVDDPIHAGHDLPPVYMMLLAFAVENLLKGIILAREPLRVGPTKLKKWEGGGHDLTQLAKVAKVEVTSDEEMLLLNLSVYAEWMGRYPCPLNHDDRLPRTAGEGFAPLGGIVGSDFDLALGLCGKFERILHTESSGEPR